jgi:ribA/ribD-fused uncharacterized protein
MERSSYFIKHKALFGSFPTQEGVKELENVGVQYFVNLTHSNERKINPYHTDHNYISFPIRDNQVPEDCELFSAFIVKLADIICNLKEGKLMYIHCKGGHGRSGIVVASLLCHIFGLSPTDALEYTTLYHSHRKSMREKWRKIGSPQTYKQKEFVHKLCKPINFYRACKVGRTAGFSNFTRFPVIIKNFGKFPTAEAALQAYKDPENLDYVNKQISSRSPLESKNIGKKANVRKDWKKVREQIMYKILENKFLQHSHLRQVLLATCLSPIIHHTKDDNIWGNGRGNGLNLLGKLLVQLRTKFQREIYTI